ncbi:hypothetical protein X946_4141 [Burkholderia sp. ABCPW 111]|nr:hypothetical protein X946_4141 [Burkholderia sp. ABCPW 111]
MRVRDVCVCDVCVCDMRVRDVRVRDVRIRDMNVRDMRLWTAHMHIHNNRLECGQRSMMSDARRPTPDARRPSHRSPSFGRAARGRIRRTAPGSAARNHS